MFLVNFFKKILSYTKIFNKQATLILLGLDNAGKTTMLFRLKEDRIT